MDIGFIGLGNMGFPMARRLVEAKHRLGAPAPAAVETGAPVAEQLAA